MGINELVAKIENLKTTYRIELAKDEAVAEIQALNVTLAEYSEERISINTKEEQLGWSQSEFVKLGEAVESLKPFEELWFLIRDKSDKLDQWRRVKSIFTLNPEEIDRDIKTMT